jgi:hypothetical protein
MQTLNNANKILCWKEHIQNNPFPKHKAHSKRWLIKYLQELNTWDDTAICPTCRKPCWYKGTKQQLKELALAKLAACIRGKRFNIGQYFSGKYKEDLKEVKIHDI